MKHQPSIALGSIFAILVLTRHVGAFTVQPHRTLVPNRLRKIPSRSGFAPFKPAQARSHRGESSTVTQQKAVGAAAAAAAATASATLPSWKAISLACVLPTCLGFYKREYGVSYAYGTATSVVGYMVYRSLPSTATLAAWHAGALMFYGVRLNLFLLYRELFVPRIKDMIADTEDKAQEKEHGDDGKNRFLNRAPFILSCSFLYYGLCTPILVTAQLFTGGSKTPLANWVSKTLTGLISVMWFGFVMAALGDATKSAVKAKKGDDHLVTGGIFRFFRHPNYTGEVIGWTANCMAGVLGAATMDSGVVKKAVLAGYVLASLFSTAGINFVLGRATNSLEKKQKKAYGDLPGYQDWIKRSWVGFQVNPKPQDEEEHVEPHLELTEEEEERGSGI